MINSKARFALLSSASTAVALFVAPASAEAQTTTCSQVGTTITCVDGTTTVLTATTDPVTTTVPGPGLVTVNTTGASTITTTATGPIATTGVTAVNLTSTGGALTFTPSGTTAPVNISTTGGVAANGLVLNTTGQAATATVGNISTTGTNSFGVLANGGTDLTLRTGNIAVTGAGSTAISANAQTGTVSLNTGNLTATGTGGQGALITTTGPLTATVGNVSTAGNGLVVNAGTSPVNLTTGTVTTTELGAAGTTINTTGAITFNGGKQTANGANALRITGGAAPINVTVAGASTTNGGNAVSVTGSGPLTLNNTGSITTTGINSTGLSINGVTTATVSCGNVSTTGANSPAVTVVAAGTTNLTCGTVSTTGAASDGVQLTNSAGTTTFTGGTTTATGAGSRGIVVTSSAPAATGLVTVNTGAVTANGNAVTATSTGGANVVVNATGNITSTTGTGITATTGGNTTVTIGAGNTVTGVQGVNLAGATGNTLVVNGTLRNAAGTTPYTVLGGGPFTLTLGTAGAITGPLTFTAGNDTFNNQGTFALPATLDFLAGTDVLNNSGTLTGFTGNSTILGLETFNNSGLIDLRNGVANNVLTLPGTNYVASGNAALGIDVVGAGGVNAADRLVIGGTTTGTTTVLANFVNPVIDTTGALIVDSSLNNLAAGQFVLGGATNQGLIDYGIQIRGGDAYLVSTPDARIYETTFIGRQMRDLWYSSADAYNSYATARRVSYGLERSHPLGIWAQLYGERQTSGDESRDVSMFGSNFTVSDRIRTNIEGAQGGLDFGGSNFVIGVTGGYERAKGYTPGASLVRTEGHNYGAYAQFGMSTGLYAGVLIKRDDLHTTYSNGAIANGFAQPNSHTDGIEGEVGFRTGGMDNINFDFGLGFAYVHSDFDAFNFGNIAFARDELNSERGQAHVRATFAGTFAPFIEVRGFHEFRDNNSYLVQSGLANATIDGANKGTWARIEAGIGGGINGGPLISAWANVGDVSGFGLRAGFRF